MPTLRLFGPVREIAGTGTEQVEGATVDEVIAGAVVRYGDPFAEILKRSRIWVNGESAEGARVLSDHDEVAVLPPVSGG